MRLTAYWNADEGQANFSKKEVEKLFAEHPVVTADFLQDVVADSTALYELARKGLFETQDERRRTLSKWFMTPEQLASVKAGKALMEPGVKSTPMVDPYAAIQWPETPRKAPLWPFAAIGFAAVAAAVLWGWG